MPAPMTIPRRNFLLAAAGVLTSCQRLAKLETAVDGIEQHERTQDEELKRLAEENQKQWAKMNCNNEEVRDFLKACEQGGSECSPKAIEGAMAFLDTQDYVSLYLRPDQRAFMMIPLRRGLFIKLTKRIYLFPTTKFLIIVQPREEDQAHAEEARRAGEDVSQFLRFDLRLPANRPVLGPYILPCKSKMRWISHYGDRYDLPQPGEPPKKEDRIRVWCFRTDC